MTAEVKPETIIFRAGKDIIITEYQRVRRHGGGRERRRHEAAGEALPLPRDECPGGTPTTRDWPMKRSITDEKTDHFHQKSAWFCHGDVIPEGLELKTKSKDKEHQRRGFL